MEVLSSDTDIAESDNSQGGSDTDTASGGSETDSANEGTIMISVLIQQLIKNYYINLLSFTLILIRNTVGVIHFLYFALKFLYALKLLLDLKNISKKSTFFPIGPRHYSRFSLFYRCFRTKWSPEARTENESSGAVSS